MRPNSQGFEIVAGARRFRAALLAEVFSLPACIREMTDAEILEAQLVELSIAVKRFLSVFAGLHVLNMVHDVQVCYLREVSQPSVGSFQLLL